MINGKEVLIGFNNDELTINTSQPENESLLSFYCSGGATIAGNYKRIDEGLDQDQIDRTIYHNNLNLQGIGFDISIKSENGEKQLTVLP